MGAVPQAVHLHRRTLLPLKALDPTYLMSSSVAKA